LNKRDKVAYNTDARRLKGPKKKIGKNEKGIKAHLVADR